MFDTLSNLKKLLGFAGDTPAQNVKPNQQAALQAPLNNMQPQQATQIPRSIRRPVNPDRNFLGSTGDIQVAPPNWRYPPVPLKKWVDPIIYGEKNQQGQVEGDFEGIGSQYLNQNWDNKKPTYRRI